jgi:hypothetical protein
MAARPPLELYEKVNALPSEQVAEALSLPRARERFKYACVACTSSDALDIRHGKPSKCFSCGRSFSNVDLAMHAWGVEKEDACQRLADQFGVITPTPLASSPRRPIAYRRPAAPTPASRQKPDVEPPALARLRDEGIIPQLPPVVYAAILEALTLTADGTTYLRSRGLEREAAIDYGFRSIDGEREWTALGEALRSTFRPDPASASARWAPPWGGRAPALVLPFRVRADVVGLQLRDMRVGVQKDKYRTLMPAGATLPPFNADALLACAGEVLHVAEGELNAFTLMSAGAIAVGLKSAIWPEAWTPALEHVRRLVVWFDFDQASDPKAVSFASTLQARFGSTWLQERTRRVPLPLSAAGKNLDANDLHLRGVLRDYIARAAD